MKGPILALPGQFTDDGSMALCLAVALLGSDSDTSLIHPSVVQMNLYRRITVRTALNTFISHYDQAESNKLTSATAYYGNASNNASGNDSLMRLAPIPLLYHQDPLNAMIEAVNSSKTTHASLLCLDCCRVPDGLPNDYWTTKGISPLEPSVLAVMTGSYKHCNPPQIKASGFVIETMEAALWAFYHTNSFQEGALKAVNLGDDADTVGAIYGMLAGAYHGVNVIPTE
ncbi:unnamed protein product [Rotaria sordida]|uniref:ADP-ribosylhydrolase ARH3 n=1 Tax=Rotaria sordida TaxID=392033 RepID=A0A819MSE8_9BILA|nr:unnamed protein product [Rotaria sordida]CAF1436403.1 unnamed protein product [Rotaria sordida]CAF3983190.1 unnamed protein product [Rotaria sordida]CAF4029597.1 unnamed protein product [Rotaria sordida]